MDSEDHGSAILPLLGDLRAHARFLVAQRAEADDLVHETVTRALAAPQQIAGGGDLRAALFVILRTVFYERAGRGRAGGGARTAERRAGPRARAGADLGELELHWFELAPPLREALLLTGVQGLSNEAAARICAVSATTVKRRAARARTLLAGMMQSARSPDAQVAAAGCHIA